MRYTKSDIVMDLVSAVQEQNDFSLIDKIKRETGIDLLNEDDFTDEDLEQMAVQEVSIDPHHLNALQNVASTAGKHISSLASTIGGHIANAATSVGQVASAHPAIAGAAALGLGAAAALRARSNMKARAQARAAGMAK